jgi:hypothetical protein
MGMNSVSPVYIVTTEENTFEIWSIAPFTGTIRSKGTYTLAGDVITFKQTEILSKNSNTPIPFPVYSLTVLSHDKGNITSFAADDRAGFRWPMTMGSAGGNAADKDGNEIDRFTFNKHEQIDAGAKFVGYAGIGGSAVPVYIVITETGKFEIWSVALTVDAGGVKRSAGTYTLSGKTLTFIQSEIFVSDGSSTPDPFLEYSFTVSMHVNGKVDTFKADAGFGWLTENGEATGDPVDAGGAMISEFTFGAYAADAE